MQGCNRNRQKQSGLVIIIFTIALTVLLGFAALAIDMNHVVLNKARLQNSVDAAALAAAVVADAGSDTKDIANATLDALKTYASSSGNSEIEVTQNKQFSSTGASLSLPLSDSATLSIQFSNDPTVFPQASFSLNGAGGEANDIYIRVQVSGVELQGFFVSLFGIEKSVSASAVAGPSSSVEELCNLVPMAACAINNSDDKFGGYKEGQLQTLKSSDWKKSELGSPGNFGLLNFGDNGKGDIDEQLAGGYEGCLEDGIAHGATGNKVGVVKNGLNTRFGDSSSSEYPPDILTTSGEVTTDDADNVLSSTFTYSDYVTETSSANFEPVEGGEAGRRMLQIPIIDCENGIGNGNNYEAPVVTIGCFFLTSKAPQSNGNDDQIIYGEFVSGCRVNNASFGLTPSNTGAYKIQLYQDPNSEGV
ncbi:Tad domain-containing protein [Vibrio rarus]|uniref:Tad domain-containing protein n=1 Tax=Vibrio rarus TaxID=413403 RepID=UPI0021C3F22A|nr:Tad domain-containing protein [Vibrio rarus]